jgi:hypothetical protein
MFELFPWILDKSIEPDVGIDEDLSGHGHHPGRVAENQG